MTGTYDFTSRAVRDDPHPLFRTLREHDPVYDTGYGYWYVSRYDDASALLRDDRLVAGKGVPDSLGLTAGPLRDVMDAWMMAIDGPAHTRTRRLISRAFTPRAVEGMRPDVQALAEHLVDALVARGGGDVVRDLAFPLPMEVVRRMFAVDAATWDSDIVALFDPGRAPRADGVVGQMGRLTEWFGRFVDERRAAPGDDLFSALMAVDEAGDHLSDHELVANGVLLLTAGFETTMALIANLVRTLLLHQDQWELVRRDPSRARGAVEEVLRYEPAALSTTRTATTDIEVRGTTIPAGANVLVSVVAANRDPERYADPDRFDVTRVDVRPLTFGGGAHVCIGAALARLEAEVVLTTLVERAPGIRLVDGGQCRWQADNPTVRRPVTLEVRV
jgi:cytochrome P450